MKNEILNLFSRSSAKIAIVSADDAECLTGLKIDVFVSMSSMQEMTTTAISDYFKLIQKSNAYFYCCNREEKKLPGGTVIRFSEYPWGSAKILFKSPIFAAHLKSYSFKRGCRGSSAG